MIGQLIEIIKIKGYVNPFRNVLPSEEQINEYEKYLNIRLPESYKKCLESCSNVSLGGLQLLIPSKSGDYLDIYQALIDINSVENFPKNFLPFVFDNADYFCFNLNKNAPDYEVVYWSHNGQTDEKWANFDDWVEKCWIGEQENQDNSLIDGF